MYVKRKENYKKVANTCEKVFVVLVFKGIMMMSSSMLLLLSSNECEFKNRYDDDVCVPVCNVLKKSCFIFFWWEESLEKKRYKIYSQNNGVYVKVCSCLCFC